MGSAKGTSQTSDVDTQSHGRSSRYYPLSLETWANNAILSLPPRAELLIFFMLVLRRLQWRDTENHMESDSYRMNSMKWWW